jgi:type VI secretion system secreted protein Hcp
MSTNLFRQATGVAALLVVFGVCHTAVADQVFVTVDGSRQGVLKGESTRVAGKLDAIKVGFQVSAPVSATGQATGRRTYSPVRITKLAGAASPQLLQALITNEILRSVTIDFVGRKADGSAQLMQSIVLQNAKVTNIERYSEPGGVGEMRALEDISFSFQRIQLTDVAGQTTALDDLGPQT